MSGLNKIDLGTMLVSSGDAANTFLEKICGALNWIASPKGMNAYRNDAYKSIIDEISKRKDINPIERAAIVSNFKQIIKEFRTKRDVAQLALKHLNPDSNKNTDAVSDDWIAFFFDKVKNVTEDNMKELWAKILAGEFNEPNTYTKQLLHTMSIMDSKIAKRFQKIRSSCFYCAPRLYAFMYRTNGDNIKNTKKYERLKIFIGDLRELDSLGLIQYRFSDFHTLVIKNKVFDYGDKRIRLNTDVRSIALGNVALTDVGKQLCRISPMIYDNNILEICLDSWKKLGYNPTVEAINN